MSEKLKKLRQRLDVIDENIQALITQRAELVQEVGKVKKTAKSTAFYRPEREAQIFRKILRRNKGPLDNDSMVQVFRALITGCLALEKKISVAFLGPEGTFSHMAALKQFGKAVLVHPRGSISEVFHAVASKASEFGIVPIENSTGGVIQETLTALMSSKVQICAEVILPVQHCVFRQAKAKGAVKYIYAHQQSFLQCSQWIAKHYPNAKKIAVESNAAAAVLASKHPHVLAFGGEILSDIYPLKKIADRIEDHTNNQTRFWVIGRQDVAPSGEDKTTLLVTTPHTPGILFKLLQPFSDYGVNISWIESRPYQHHNWSYLFFLDIDGHQEDKAVKSALAKVVRQPITLTILGSYPKAIL